MSSRYWSARGVLACAAVLAALGMSQAADKPADAEKKPANITVLLPESRYAPAELKIEGVLSKQSGDKREFITPPLEPGKTYSYTVSVMIQPNNYTKITRTKEVLFKAGDSITVDLRQKQPKEDVRIRWVPTPKDVVVEMGKLAKIGKNDVVYDLGCGNGVMLITAVKELGAKKGIGIDVDPQRIKDAKELVAEEKVGDKIEIRQGNILKLDPKEVADANVVMLYLGDYMNSQLRPYLWKSLKPGTRIVSHRFIMGDWKPDKTVTVMGKDGDEYVLHLWTITGKEQNGEYPKQDK